MKKEEGFFDAKALPSRSRDLPQLRQNGSSSGDGRLSDRPAVPASGSTPGSHPCGALSSAQVLLTIEPEDLVPQKANKKEPTCGSLKLQPSRLILQ